MSTIDLTQVSGIRAVDAEGKDLGPVSLQDLTDSITTQVLQTLSMRQQAATLEEPALLSASAQSAGSDTYENQLPQQSDLKWARALDASGNPILISKEDLAGVVGGLLGTLNQKQNAYNKSVVEYVRIASKDLQEPSLQEGLANTLTLIISGGNAYTGIRQVSFVSITSHRGVIYAKKNSILSSVEIGYSVNGNRLDVWVHTAEYRHIIDSVLLGSSNAILRYDTQIEMPNNYKIIE